MWRVFLEHLKALRELWHFVFQKSERVCLLGRLLHGEIPAKLGLKFRGKVYLRYDSGLSQYESEALFPDSNVWKSMTEFDLSRMPFSLASSPIM